jgi:hypothetical protein
MIASLLVVETAELEHPGDGARPDASDPPSYQEREVVERWCRKHRREVDE